MNGERHAGSQRRRAGVHPLGALRTDRDAEMLIAPVEMVVGEQVDAHAERLHAPELRSVGKLAMLQREAVVGRRMFAQGRFQAVQRQRRRLVAVRMRVDLQARGERAPVDLQQMLRRDVPQSFRRPVIIAGPAQPRRKSLDRAVRDQLDDAEAQIVLAAFAQIEDASDQLFRRQPVEAAQRNDARRIVGLGRHPHHHVHRIVRQQIGQIGGRRHTGAHAQFGKSAQAGLVAGQQVAVEPGVNAQRGHRIRAFHLGIIYRSHIFLLHPTPSRVTTESQFRGQGHGK